MARKSWPAPAPLTDSPRTPAWAQGLVRLMDDGLTVPGTRIGIGLDALLGFFFPTLGDAATGVGSLALLWLAFRQRVPKVVILRMVLNIAADVVIGSIPLLGDVFDLYFRSNRRNLQLLQRYENAPQRRADLGDYLIVGLGVLLVLLAIVLPLILGVALLRYVWNKF